uniref:ATP-dependent DNA helicase n=1 Tax=Nicotiana sylvestris TaxID=4096 RepID=A0A1U7X3Z2_NICSY|nr:PREDICTED: uncharacterized protein LOC104230465 [Nicotiana sylvestris]
MAKKEMVEALDLLLRDLMETTMLFGGKVVVFSGDFRQTLPVVRGGQREDFVRESLLCSEIWHQLEKLQLSENMRAKTDPAFCEYLMRIGNGKENKNDKNKIEIPRPLIIPFTTEKDSLNHLFKVTYPDLYLTRSNISFFTSRAILTTKNDFVDEINDMLIAQFPADEKVYLATDETIDPKDQSEYDDFLHALNPPAQGQTLDFVGIYLREPVFSHGQLYVALSRAKGSNCVKILIRPIIADDDDDHSTYNVVYDEIIEKAFAIT